MTTAKMVSITLRDVNESMSIRRDGDTKIVADQLQGKLMSMISENEAKIQELSKENGKLRAMLPRAKGINEAVSDSKLSSACDKINDFINDGGHWRDVMPDLVKKYGATEKQITDMYKKINGATPDQVMRDLTANDY